jgi:hypothetical protein
MPKRGPKPARTSPAEPPVVPWLFDESGHPTVHHPAHGDWYRRWPRQPRHAPPPGRRPHRKRLPDRYPPQP